METCSTCGATLSPDLEWCGRCLTPVARSAEDRHDQGALWVRTQRREHVGFEGAQFSRWRAGPTSFGPIGRAVLTALVLMGCVIGYPLARGGMVAAVGMDVPGKPFLVGYATVAGVAAVYLIFRIWKRARVA
jgi:hypothetical protein